MLRLASDADVHGEIVRGLRRRRPEIDLVRVQDALPEGNLRSFIIRITGAAAAAQPCQDARIGGSDACDSSSPLWLCERGLTQGRPLR